MVDKIGILSTSPMNWSTSTSKVGSKKGEKDRRVLWPRWRQKKKSSTTQVTAEWEEGQGFREERERGYTQTNI